MFLGGNSLISSSKSLSLGFLNDFFKMLVNGLTEAKHRVKLSSSWLVNASKTYLNSFMKNVLIFNFIWVDGFSS